MAVHVGQNSLASYQVDFRGGKLAILPEKKPMAVALEKFLKQLEDSGIVAPGRLENFMPPKAHPKDAEELARQLIKAGNLTPFQAQHVLQGKAKALILGNYTILDKIGAGGMGQVFKAEHRRMKRIVAIKMLPPAVTKDAAAVARFLREVEAAAKLSHPNIVAAYDSDEANGAHFLVMEYVEGRDLSALVKKSGPLPVGQAVNCILQAARGLEFAHGEGLVHRDIKPANLLLDTKGVVKILDMGLARIESGSDVPAQAELTGTGAVMGTVDYMAPEQAMDSRYADARSDIYSLGCTLYYLLTGQPPYNGDTVMKRLTAHQRSAIPLLSTSRSDIPPGVQEVFGKMVAKSPEARFQAVPELLATLELLRVPESFAASPVSAASVPCGEGIELGPSNKQSRFIASLAAVVVIVLLAGAAGIFSRFFYSNRDDLAQRAPPQLIAQRSSEAPQRAVLAESNPLAEQAGEPAKPPRTPAQPPASIPRPSPAGSPPKMPEPSPDPAVNSPSPASPPIPSSIKADPTPIKGSSSPDLSAVAFSPPVETNSQPVAASPTVNAKLPVPSVEAQGTALKLLNEIYKNDIAEAKSPEAKTALAEKLLAESQSSKDDTTSLYIVLHEARRLAIEAANPALAERAIELLAERYELDPLKDFAAALDEMTAKPHAAETNRSIAEAALAYIAKAEPGDNFEVNKRFAEVAVTAARKAKDPTLLKRATETMKTVTTTMQQWEAWQKAKAALAKSPDDPTANLAAGRYLCFLQGDWEQGLSHLAKGSDGPWRDLAAKSQKPTNDPAALTAIGDAWFSAAEKAKGKEKADMRAGAAHWYSQAEPGLTGLAKTKVMKRLGEIGLSDVPKQSQGVKGKTEPENIELAVAPNLSIKFRLIPAGKFMMGSLPSEAGRVDGEDQHEVSISKPFYMAITETTQAQWLAVMGDNPSHFSGDLNRPLENITWDQANQFGAILSQSPLGRAFHFRLPTEAEWERACRAGSKTRFCFGDDAATLAQYGWYKDNAAETNHPVAQLKPNEWGLYDMHGNVGEWCADWFDANYYLKSSPADPTGPSSGVDHVNRGGNILTPPYHLRCADRRREPVKIRHFSLGFRLVCEPVGGFKSLPR
jgi:serine/threonine protein kinase/formylglycine-generating enzyme required for sulfatase activity